ncbi:thioredoxin [Corynebacterium sp. zg254]|uniref:Thioredoxin n=1 Tax=Corynebacterium zhongnanshanii TaxID=2768834 RepID=A0ABQ6VCA2_9CORY|nr:MULTISPECIES: thioredoxin [Corynebacterium]KAB3519217.1 thioredoxin [Corynebacterium zhongnanshanii]MCR5915071.1 thioredoxin [Corynebacterium sp. zg254]
MATVEITTDNFKDTITAEGVTVLDFWADWCGPCKRFSPIFESVSDQHEDVTFGKVDTEANQDLAAALQIQSIPTLMVFRDGVLLSRESGILPEKPLYDLIQEAKDLDMDAVKAQLAEQQAAAEE